MPDTGEQGRRERAAERAAARERLAAGEGAPADLLDTPQAGPTAIRGGTLRLVGYGVGVLLSVASAPLMIRHLGVVDFGRFVTVTSIVTIVAAVTDAGLTNIGVREYALRGPGARRLLIRNLLGMRSALTVAGVLLAVGFTLLAGYPDVVVAGTLLTGFGLLLNIVQVTYQVPLSTGLRLGWITAIELAKQVATVALILALVVASAELFPFYFTMAAAGVAGLAMTVPLVRGELSLRPAAQLDEWWGLVRDALAYAAATAIGVIYFRVEVVLMSLISTEQETGYFGAAFRIVEILAGVPLLASLTVFPILARAAHDDPERLRYALQRLFDVYLIVGLGIGLAFVVGAEFAIDVVAGDDFGPSVEVLQIMGASMVATFLVSIWGFGLLALRRHAALLGANLSALAVGGALTVLLVPPEGALGAAIAIAATELVLAALYAVLLVRSRPDLRVSAIRIPRIALACAAGGGAAYASGLSSGPAAALAVAVYAALLLLLRAVPREMLDAFLRRETPDGADGDRETPA